MKKWFTDKTKLWKVMKICAAQAMMAMILAGISMAHVGEGQILDTKISLDLKDVSLERALVEIERVAKVKFVYSEAQLDLKEVVTFAADNQTLDFILNELLSPLEIKYKVYEKESTITLKRQGGADPSKEPDRNQERKKAVVTGKVTDAVTRQGLAGVNVLIKGTTMGTTTDAEGNFSIQANEGDRLVFSFIGYISFETTLDSRSVIDVALQEDMTKLNEVVVNAGYWTVKEKEQTGNIARITAEEIKTQPVSNPLLALSGRMAGVMVTQSNGLPGGGLQVQIRGRNSINSGNDPLYIIDGIPVVSTAVKSVYFGGTLSGGNPFSSLNPNDIESIEVLKDGAATAVYGSRGANGVILITTKKGVAGKMRLDLNFSSGVSQVSNTMNLMGTNDYLTMRREGFKNDNITPVATNGFDLVVWDTTRYTDWQKKLIGNTGRITNLNATLSGGSKKTQVSFSGGYYKETTVFPGDFAFNRGTANLSISHKSVDEKLQLLFSINYQLESNQMLNDDLTSQALLETPVSPETHINGKINWGPSTGFFDNPYAKLLKKYNVNTNNLRSNAMIGYTILPGLQLKTNLGYNRIQTEDNLALPIASNNPRFGVTTGEAYFGNGSNTTWVAEPQVEYKKSLGRSSIVALLGMTFQRSIRTYTSLRGTGYINDQLLDNIQGAATVNVMDASTTEYSYQALFGRINYSLKEKYIFDLVGRRDGSSRFGPENRYANFGSISSAWIFSRENLISQSLRFLSFGKLRVSYGTSGNDQIGDYGYLDTYSTFTVPIQGVVPMAPTRLANPTYSWETNKKLEGGLELGFFQDRLLFGVSYYRNHSSNQLVGLPLSGVTGFTSIQANLGATVENSGWEFELNTVNIKSENLSWTSGFNLTVPQNKLLEYQNLESSPYANRFVIGQSINIDKVYKYQGVDPATGIYQYQDLDGSNSITSPVDNQTIVNTLPALFGGLNNSLRYKNWTLNFFFQFVQQKGVGYFASFNVPGLIRNQPQEVMARWRSAGDIGPFQKFSTTVGPAYNAYQTSLRSELYYVDASFIRLKSVSLYYDLPKKWVEKIKMQRSQFYIQGQNLLTFTPYKGLDPENRSFINLPPLRIVSVGIELTF